MSKQHIGQPVAGKLLGVGLLLVCVAGVEERLPLPPGVTQKLLSPKSAELQSSLGSTMVKAAAIPAFVPPLGFLVTNITVSNGQVSLAWQNGTPPFHVEGSASPNGPWSVTGNPVSQRSATFPAGSNNYWRLRYSTNQSDTWARAIGGTGTDYGGAVAVDSSGNVLVTGVFSGAVDFGGGILTSAGGYDVYLAKYSPIGAHIWSKQYGGTGSEVPKSIAQDSSGNIFIAGSLNGGQLMKLDSLGALQWTKGPVATGIQSVAFSSIATDSQGNIIATGSFVAGFNTPMDFGNGITLSSAFGSTDAFLAKYSPAGACLWAKSFANFGDTEYGNGVTVDHSDNILLAGYAFSGIDLGGGNLENGGYGAYGYLAKFTPTGDHVWSRKAGSKNAGDPSYAFSRTRGLSLDSNGDVTTFGDFNYQADYGGGMRFASAPNANGFMAKYANADGHWLWDTLITGNLNITPTSLATDSQNNLILTGAFRDTYSFSGITLTATGQRDIDDCFVAKYSGAGSVIWAKKFGGTSSDNGNGIAVDLGGFPFVTGAFQGTGSFGGTSLVTAGGVDAFLMRINP